MNKHISEVLRYALNGLVATAVHFVVLTFLLKQMDVPSAGIANFFAAIFGILTSFLGNRYFVFPVTQSHFVKQLIQFSSLYGVIAIFHGITLLVMTDWFGIDYRIGFLAATILQVSMSYVGNKLMVFKL